MRLVTLALTLFASQTLAQAPDSRFSAGGYFRIAARPDFQGGNGQLGYSNLYGRLMNEGSYAALEMKLDLLQAPPGSNEIWASLIGRVEGSSVQSADAGKGNLVNFRVSQLYVRAGNILAPNVVWQLGTLWYYFGDLGLYDIRGAQIFEDTVGLSGRFTSKYVDVLVGVGDSGYGQKATAYVPLLTAGGAVRVRLGEHLEVGGGGQVAVEPFIAGNKNSSYETPGVNYEDFVRGEVLKSYLTQNPLGGIDSFPNPQRAAQTNVSWRTVGYLGFGKLGPLRWSSLFARYARLHPQTSYVDSFNNQSVTVYVADQTRDRYQLQVGNEMQFRLIPDRLDAAWGVLYGSDRDYANTIQASEANRTYLSTVLRLQLFLTKAVHLLAETSLAQERSLNGNLYRSNFDSIFANTNGVVDSRGLQYGDSPLRNTWQVKAGVVLNPSGYGIYARPSIRLLYGFQYSSQHAAFGNAFITQLGQFNAFMPTGTISWHHLVSLEAEGWF